MKIYSLDINVDTEETGYVYPSIIPVNDYDYNSSESVYKLNNQNFPNFRPNLRFKWKQGSKPTDFISQSVISASGLVINNRIKKEFLDFESIPIKSYEISIEDEKEKSYSWLHAVWMEKENIIDYQNTIFQISRVSKKSGEFKFKNRQEHLNKQGELGFISILVPKILSLKNVDFEIFTHPMGLKFLVKESTANLIINRNYSGLKIQLEPTIKYEE